MHQTIIKEVKKTSLKDLVPKLIGESIAEDITKKAKKIFPIQNCIVRKVKSIKRPKFDLTQLLSIHQETATPVVEKKEEVKAE